MGISFDDVIEYLKQAFNIKSCPRLGNPSGEKALDFFSDKADNRLGIVTILKHDIIYLSTKDSGLFSFGFNIKNNELYHVFYVGDHRTSQTNNEALSILKEKIEKQK